MAEDMTVGELSRRLTYMEAHLDKRFDDIKGQVASLQFVNKEVYTKDINNIEGRLDKIEEAKQWTQRFVISAIILAIFAPVVVSLLLNRLQ